MSKDNVIDSLGRIDDDMIRGVESLRRKKKRTAWLRWGAMAACLCLILFGLYHLFPDQAMEGTEGADGKEISDQNPMENVIQDSLINAPENLPEGEIPNVILFVEEMTPEGFIATVTEFGETQRLGLGTKLNVVIAEGTRSETADGDHPISGESQTDLSGCYVVVNFYEFDEATGTIVVDTFSVVDEEG